MFKKYRYELDFIKQHDPAARSDFEIFFLYKGFRALRMYRKANKAWKKGKFFKARYISERCKFKTGIEIHPGATVGRGLFIDHGTGVVIGETTVIGKHVKLYQNVTLGALSLRKGQELSGVKRHPTVENNVTIYSGASILGGETVIGEGAVIGGNCFLTESVAPGTKVTTKPAELIFIDGKKVSKTNE